VEAALTSASPDDLAMAQELLEEWSEGGIEFAASFPTSITRLRAEVAVVLGDAERARSLFGEATERCRAAGASLELARVLVGWSGLEAVRSKGSPDLARRLAVEARDLAERLGLPAVGRDAVALARSAIDHPMVVSRRGGDWRVIMITDIVGSTAISSNLGDVAYLNLVLEHHNIVRQCLTAWNGHEFSEAGDSLLAWFDDTESAVRAAFAVQDAVALRRRSGAPLSVRIALSGGDPLFHGGRPYGLVLNRAARIVGTTRAADVLVDEAVATDLPPFIRVLSRVERMLSGIGSHTVSRISAD
jgi:class 3 adenylate cyclase